MTPPQQPEASADAVAALERARSDLLAYGRHFEGCLKRVIIAPTRRHAAPIHPHDCSCGYDEAVKKVYEALR